MNDLMFQERLGQVSRREEFPSFSLSGPKRTGVSDHDDPIQTNRIAKMILSAHP
jgi:hypothetical protein